MPNKNKIDPDLNWIKNYSPPNPKKNKKNTIQVTACVRCDKGNISWLFFFSAESHAMTWVVDTPARLIASTNGCVEAPFFLGHKKRPVKKPWIHPGRLTWTINMEVWKIIFLSKWVICRFHVNLPGCTLAVYIFFKHLFKASLDFPDQIQPLNWGRWSLGSRNFGYTPGRGHGHPGHLSLSRISINVLYHWVASLPMG